MQDATGFKDGRRDQEPRNAILETKKARKWIFPWSCWHVDFSIMKFILHFLQNYKRIDLCCFKSLTLCYTNNRKLIHFPKSKVNENIYLPPRWHKDFRALDCLESLLTSYCLVFYVCLVVFFLFNLIDNNILYTVSVCIYHFLCFSFPFTSWTSP